MVRTAWWVLSPPTNITMEEPPGVKSDDRTPVISRSELMVWLTKATPPEKISL